MKKRVLSIILLIMILSSGIVLSSNKEEMKYEIADAHTHYTDWVQGTEGVASLIESMDAAKVSDTVFWGIPLSKLWREEEGFDRELIRKYDISPRVWDKETDYIVANAFLAAKPEHKKRLHPFICGINGQDKTSLEHVKRMIQLYPGVFKGIGEIFSYHDFASWLTYGETPHPDSEAFDMVYKFAAKYGLPINIHCNITAARIGNPIYLSQMENAIKNNPKTKFIWAHVGVSNLLKINNLVNIADDLLAKYSNLNFDLSWIVFENYIALDGKLDQKWVDLIKKYPDRFMIGSDLVGHFKPVDSYVNEIRKYDVLLNALPEDVAKKVAKENFFKILPKKGVTLLPEDMINI